MNHKNRQLLLLFLSGTLFLALYVMLAMNNRLPYEDHNFLFLSKEMGPLKAMLDVYEHYSARWSAHTLAFYFSLHYENRYFLLLFNCITLATLLASFYLLLKKALTGIAGQNISQSTLAAYSLLFLTGFFLSSFSIGEAWFWYMVSWMYMWSIIAGNFLLLIMLSEKTRLWHIPFIVLLTAYIAGAAESYAAVWILLLAALLIVKQKNIFPRISQHFHNRSLLIALISLSLLYLFTLLAPGTAARKGLLTDATFVEHLIMCLKAYGILILKKTPFILPQLLLFGLPWIFLGKEFESKDKTEVKKIIPLFLKSTLLIGIIIFILILPASWVLYDLPPDRALSQVSLLLCAFAAVCSFYLGYKTALSLNTVRILSLGALTGGLLLLGWHLQEQYSITKEYSDAYDSRLEKIIEEKKQGRTTPLSFEPLPPSGMLYSDELSPDSASNSSFEKIYGSGFQVTVKDTETK